MVKIEANTEEFLSAIRALNGTGMSGVLHIEDDGEIWYYASEPTDVGTVFMSVKNEDIKVEKGGILPLSSLDVEKISQKDTRDLLGKEIKISYEEGKPIDIKGKGGGIRIFPLSPDEIGDVDDKDRIKFDKDGKWLLGGKEPSDIVIKISSSELKKAVKILSIADVDYVDYNFKTKGDSECISGHHGEGNTKGYISKTKVSAKVEGADKVVSFPKLFVDVLKLFREGDITGYSHTDIDGEYVPIVVFVQENEEEGLKERIVFAIAGKIDIGE